MVPLSLKVLVKFDLRSISKESAPKLPGYLDNDVCQLWVLFCVGHLCRSLMLLTHLLTPPIIHA